MRKGLFLCCVSIFFLFFFVPSLQADQLDDISRQLDDLKKTFSELSKANQTNETQLQGLQKQLNDIKNKVVILEGQIETKQAQVVEGEKAFAAQQKLLNQRARSYYKNMGKNSFSVVNLLLSDNISESLQNYFYQKTLVDEDKKAIVRIALFIKQVEDKKKTLEAEKASLATVKAEVDKQSTFLAGEVAKSKKALGELQNKIASLTSQQQQLIAAKESAFASVAGKTADTQTSGGACGASSISYPSNIRVKFPDGHIESMSFEDQYLKGLGEMPRAWSSVNNYQEAFKSQVVAARTYALFKMVRSSCRDFDVYSTTADQVYTGNTGDENWNRAVSDTKGQFLQNGGNVIIAYYSANAGGHTLSPNESWNGGGSFPSGVNDMGGDGKPNSDLNSRCIGTLRWEYHYNIGRDGKVQYNDTCPGGDINNNNSPMNNSEVEDIVDATIWATKNGRVPDNSMNHDQIKNEIGGDSIGSIQSISASIADSKYTNNVHVVGSNRTVDFSGAQAQTFRLVFNIRSPGNFLIMSTSYGAQFVKFDILSSSEAHGTQGDGWYFYTYGYGHRIGLDQEGALGMAYQGKPYTEILSHYYQGTSLTSKDYSGQVQ